MLTNALVPFHEFPHLEHARQKLDFFLTGLEMALSCTIVHSVGAPSGQSEKMLHAG